MEARFDCTQGFVLHEFGLYLATICHVKGGGGCRRASCMCKVQKKN